MASLEKKCHGAIKLPITVSTVTEQFKHHGTTSLYFDGSKFFSQ
jgi:hypothetical protein